MLSIRLAPVLVGLISACSSQASAPQQPPATFAETSPWQVFEGTYVGPDDSSIDVSAQADGLMLRTNGFDFLRHSDLRSDARVLACEAKTSDLIEASRTGDSQRIAELFQQSSGDTAARVRHYHETFADIFFSGDPPDSFELLGTLYRDEDAKHGFSDAGFGWETFARLVWSERERTIRFVWDGTSGEIQHQGFDKQLPRASELVFAPRAPARSWIHVYDPATGTTPMIREVQRERRAALMPTRFVAYDVDANQTVSMRFRRLDTDAPMTLELGPLNDLLVLVRER
jgi:hypothetical protein